MQSFVALNFMQTNSTLCPSALNMMGLKNFLKIEQKKDKAN